MTILQDDVILFDNVKFNNGSGYNATSGVFVAPLSGFYVLNLVLEVRSDAALRMEMLLNVNDTSIMKLFIAGETNSLGGHQQSGSLVYHLLAGSEVKVVVGVIVTETDSAPVQVENENLSYFSGYYLGWEPWGRRVQMKIEKQFRAEKHDREIMTIDGKGTVFCINPFTAPACKNSAGWKMHGGTCKQYMFRSYNPSNFNAMRFDKNPFTCQSEKENRKA